MEMLKRPRRLRGSEVLRKMVRETRMDKASLIYPMFVKEGSGIIEEIPTMPGQFRYSVDTQVRDPFQTSGRRCKKCDVFRDSRSQG